jgi:hypothetical protein
MPFQPRDEANPAPRRDDYHGGTLLIAEPSPLFSYDLVSSYALMSAVGRLSAAQ